MSGLPEPVAFTTEDQLARVKAGDVGFIARRDMVEPVPDVQLFTADQMRAGERAAVEQAKPSSELLSIGTQMANVFFNWAQEAHFTAHQRGMMTALQKKWDELARTAAPADEVAGDAHGR